MSYWVHITLFNHWEFITIGLLGLALAGAIHVYLKRGK